MTAQSSHTGQSLVNQIPTIRKRLKTKAADQPALAPILTLLDKQLRNFARGNPEDQAALKPEIRKSLAQLERTR